MRPAASDFSAPYEKSSASYEARALNLLGADTNAQPVACATGRHPGAEFRVGVESGSHGNPADRQLMQARQRRANLLLGQVQLDDVTGKFLAQR